VSEAQARLGRRVGGGGAQIRHHACGQSTQQAPACQQHACPKPPALTVSRAPSATAKWQAHRPPVSRNRGLLANQSAPQGSEPLLRAALQPAGQAVEDNIGRLIRTCCPQRYTRASMRASYGQAAARNAVRRCMKIRVPRESASADVVCGQTSASQPVPKRSQPSIAC
jgi:hypothetical protein